MASGDAPRHGRRPPATPAGPEFLPKRFCSIHQRYRIWFTSPVSIRCRAAGRGDGACWRRAHAAGTSRSIRISLNCLRRIDLRLAMRRGGHPAAKDAVRHVEQRRGDRPDNADLGLTPNSAPLHAMPGEGKILTLPSVIPAASSKPAMPRETAQQVCRQKAVRCRRHPVKREERCSRIRD